MEEYKSNSHRARKEHGENDTRKVEKVVTGNVKTKKKGGVRRFADVFLSEDIGNVKSFVIFDVIVPYLKDMFVDAVNEGANMMVRGVSDRRTRKSTPASYTQYRKYYDDRDSVRERERKVTRSSGGLGVDDIIFDNQGDAEDVLDRMDEIINEYGFVKVADFYDLAGQSAPHTANRYGWSDIRNAKIVRIRRGEYLIKMPRAMQID